LYNKAAGETGAGSVSPKDTMWAFGSIDNATTLSYKTMESLRNGNLAGRIVNQPMVVHLVAEDIYFSIKFTTWGKSGAGTVSYTRSTPAAAVAPTVSITSPSNGTSFSAPASINLTATATVTGGTVTNVEYFAGTTSLGHATASPFNVTANLTTPGSYALTAVATASGVSGTSPVVNISVTAVTAPSVAITAPTEGAVFAAPANVSFTADTSAGVTNVSYFNGRTLLGSSQTAPFNITAASLAAGAYTVSAVATTSGTSTTSSLVHFTVVDPVATSLSAPAINNGLFSFNYSANQGLTYIIQKASSLNSAGTSDWTPVATNVASSGSATFSEPVSSDAARFYRVARVPNP
ncbi:MAG: Chitinase, partial [Verrucomicrobiales bacterium]|nr:Chitinase [Verrucomicrobiales bacterium]